MDERESFVGRALLRTLAEGGDFEAGLARLSAALSSDADRQALERLKADLNRPEDMRHAGDGERDWLRVAIRTAQLIRVHGGELAPGWADMERQYAASRALAQSLSQGLIQTLTLSVLAAVVALVVTLIYVVFALPQFRTAFASLGAELPAFTQVVMGGGGVLVIVTLTLIALTLIGFPLKRSLLRGRRGAGWRLDLFAWRAFLGREVAESFSKLLFVSYASGLLRGGLADGLALSLASQEAQIYREVDFARGASTATAGDPLIHSLLTAARLGHFRQELEAQSQIRLAALDKSAERLQMLAAFVVRSLMYALVGSLVVAMYLPIFKLGAAI